MRFRNDAGKEIEINSKNFDQILRGTISGSGLLQVKFKDGTIEVVKATDQEILKAANE